MAGHRKRCTRRLRGAKCLKIVGTYCTHLPVYLHSEVGELENEATFPSCLWDKIRVGPRNEARVFNSYTV